jgi:hypothetical protein
MLRPDIKKVVQEAISQCPARFTFRVDREDTFSAPPQQRRKYSSQTAGGGKHKKLRKDDDLDDNSFPQDEPDIEESTDGAQHTASLHNNKLEHDPPSDPWKNVRPRIFDKLLTLASKRQDEITQRKNALKGAIQQRINDICSKCSSCGSVGTRIIDAPGSRVAKVCVFVVKRKLDFYRRHRSSDF